MNFNADAESLACMEIRAEAQWAGTRQALPVMGQAWFLASAPALARCGMELSELMAMARGAYPGMHSAVERIALAPQGRPMLRLRALEVFEDDLGGGGLASVRKALDVRAQVCGMRIVATLNAVAGRVVAHGMPLDRPPGSMDPAKALALIEEIEIFEASSCEAALEDQARRGRL